MTGPDNTRERSTRFQSSGAKIAGQDGSRPPSANEGPQSRSGQEATGTAQARLTNDPIHEVKMDGIYGPAAVSKLQAYTQKRGLMTSPPTGLLHSASAPVLEPRRQRAQNIPRIPKNAKVTLHHNLAEMSVWSQSNMLLVEDWPAQAIAVIAMEGEPPHVNFKEEIRFEVYEEKYQSLCVRMRNGESDHYDGGSVALFHSPDGREIPVGAIGQLLMITKLIVNRDNSITIRALGDLRCQIKKTWMPRGFRGLQMAVVDTIEAAPDKHFMLEVAEKDPELQTLARLWRSVPALAELLMGPGPLTAFAPTDDAFAELERRLGCTVDDLMKRPDFEAILACHISMGRVGYPQFYNNRDFEGLEGSLGQISFSQWPRGTVRFNGAVVSRFDIICKNGVMHAIDEVLQPGYSAGKRPTAPNPPGGVPMDAYSRDRRGYLVPQVYY